MRNSTLLLPLLVVLTMYCLVQAHQDTLLLDEWARVTGVIGRAEISSSEMEKWRPVHVGMRVKMAWSVRTHAESTVELAFESGTQIKLGENSVVKLATYVGNRHSDHSGTSENSGFGEEAYTVIPVTDKSKE